MLAERAAAHLKRLPHEPHLHVKRTLATQARELLEAEGEDPAAIALMLDRHAIELPDRPTLLFATDTSAPARDPFVEIGAGPPHPLNDALIEAEVAAATAADAEPATRLALARLAAELMEDTVALEQGWGDTPVDVSRYSALMALPTADRVQQLLGERGGGDEDPAV